MSAAAHCCDGYCPPGKYLTDDGVRADEHLSAAQCRVCMAGAYASTYVARSCVTCPAGRYLSDLGLAAASHDSSSDCTSCPAYTALPDEASTPAMHDSLDDCYACPAGKSADAGSALCRSPTSTSLAAPAGLYPWLTGSGVDDVVTLSSATAAFVGTGCDQALVALPGEAASFAFCMYKAVTISCDNQSALCVLSGESTRKVLYIQVGPGTTAALEYLSLTTGLNVSNNMGAGLIVENCAATATACSFTFNASTSASAGNGGALSASSATVTLTSCTFASNSISTSNTSNDGFGGAIFCSSPASKVRSWNAPSVRTRPRTAAARSARQASPPSPSRPSPYIPTK